MQCIYGIAWLSGDGVAMVATTKLLYVEPGRLVLRWMVIHPVGNQTLSLLPLVRNKCQPRSSGSELQPGW